jgi:hypothetical protein
MKNLLHSQKWRTAVLLTLLAVVVIAYWPLLTQTILLEADFLQYWVAGYQMLRLVDPYEYAATVAVYRSVMTLTPNEPFLYPPWLIPFFIPFSLLPLPLSRALWYFISLGLVVFGTGRIWGYFGGSKNLRWLGLLLAITFSPTLLALTWGQLGALTFAAVVLFLRMMDPDRTTPRFFLAGMALALTALKPQAFYLAWPALLLWSVRRREWRVLLGALAVLGGATLIASLFVPGVVRQYITSFLNNPPLVYATPTFGYWLREWFGRENFALQYVGPILGITWLLWDWHRLRGVWDWSERLPWLAFASIITSPFIWTHDQVLLLLPLLQSVVWLANYYPRLLLKVVFPVWVVFNMAVVLLHFRFADAWFTWQAPLLLLVYAWAIRQSVKSAAGSIPAEARKVEPV